MVAVFACLSSSYARARELKIYYGNLPPFNYLSESGQLTGISVDVLNSMIKKGGHHLTINPIKHTPLARALRYTKTNKNSILFSIARTPVRENSYKWIGPIYTLKLGLVSKKNRMIFVKDKAELRQYRIAVIRDSAPQSILENRFNYPQSLMTKVASDEQQIKMLDRNRVDLISQSNTGAPSLIRESGLDPADFEMSFTMMDLPLYFCLNKDFDDDFVNAMQQALDEIKQKKNNGKSELDLILEKYIGSDTISIRGE